MNFALGWALGFVIGVGCCLLIGILAAQNDEDCEWKEWIDEAQDCTPDDITQIDKQELIEVFEEFKD